jgi:hypothetical protein
MTRSIFFLIVAIVSVFTGSVLLFKPNFIVENNHWVSSPQTEFFIRLLGSPAVAIGVLNFLVRNHAESATLKAVLVLNIIKHSIDLVLDFTDFDLRNANIQSILPFVIGHLFIGLGSLYYLLKMKNLNV